MGLPVMDDIVAWLRKASTWMFNERCADAADEIVRLRKECARLTSEVLAERSRANDLAVQLAEMQT